MSPIRFSPKVVLESIIDSYRMLFNYWSGILNLQKRYKAELVSKKLSEALADPEERQKIKEVIEESDSSSKDKGSVKNSYFKRSVIS